MRPARALLLALALFALLATAIPTPAQAAPADLPEGIAYQDSRDERVGSSCGQSFWTYRITLSLRAGFEGDRVRLTPLGHLWSEPESVVATPDQPATILVAYPTTCANLVIDGERVATIAPYDLAFKTALATWP